MRLNAIFLFGLALLSATLAGCGSNLPTRLYVLSADTERAASDAADQIAVGVGPVTLPKYLERAQFVTRVTNNSLSQSDFNQWGGDLGDDITRVLATNLSNLLRTDRVSLYPWNDRTLVDYQITLQVMRFEEDSHGNAVFEGFWSLVRPRDGKTLLTQRSTYRENAEKPNALGTEEGTPENYSAVAAAMSRDLAAFSRDVAEAIRRQKRK